MASCVKTDDSHRSGDREHACELRRPCFYFQEREMAEPECLIRELVHVLQNKYAVDQEDVLDLLDHVNVGLSKQVRK